MSYNLRKNSVSPVNFSEIVCVFSMMKRSTESILPGLSPELKLFFSCFYLKEMKKVNLPLAVGFVWSGMYST